ncbi:hypothetical protein CKA32_003921 [Geitlerinema sp. FC II]|nr:hypothetical protein CKA32_003921 [Geitlerinema sp. FC II]
MQAGDGGTYARFGTLAIAMRQMDEQRIKAYLELIQALLSCP